MNHAQITNNKWRLYMSQRSIYFKMGLTMAFALIAADLIMACGSTPPPMSNPPTAQPEAEVAVVPPPTPTIPATATPPPAIIAPDDGCVECHSNQEMLQATAEEEVVVESLSEGEG